MLTFSNNCALLLKVNILLESILFFRKLWLLYDCLYTSRNCRILIKTSIFFRKCLFVHVFIFIKVFYLLENCYFDSKYHFIRWYFGQKCPFPSRIYISGGIHSLDKLSNFLRKGHNLGKTTIGFRSNLVVSFEKKWQLISCQLFRYVCFTGKSENRAETPILKDIFIFLANGHCFQKILFLEEILSFLKEASSVFEKRQHWWCFFPSVKNVILCKKC